MELLIIGGVCALVGAAWWMNRRARGGQDFDGLLLSAVDAFRLAEGEEAERHFAALRPLLDSTRRCRRAGRLLLDARALEFSRVVVERGLEFAPNDSTLLRLRALTLTQMLHDDGIDALHALLRAHPGDVEARLTLARALLRLRRLDEVITLLLAETRIYQPSIEGHSLLGRAFFHKRASGRARHHLEAAMALRRDIPNHTIALYDNALIRGRDVSVVVEATWEEEQDRLLLEQLASGEALPDQPPPEGF